MCLLVGACSTERRGGEPAATAKLPRASPPAAARVDDAPPAPARRAPTPTPPAEPARLAPTTNEEFDGAALADVQEALSAVDENAFATLIHRDREDHKEKRVTPDSCRAWRTLRNRGYAPKGALSEQVDAGALVRCGALEFLARAKSSRVSYVRHVLDGAGPSTLPAIVASATSKPAVRSRSVAANKGMTLSELLPGAHTVQSELPGRVSIQDPASETNVILNAEAWGDVNADEVEDVVLSVLNTSDDGTYFDMRLIEVTRASPDAPLTVIAVTM